VLYLQAQSQSSGPDTKEDLVDAFFGKFEPISGFTFVIGVLTCTDCLLHLSIQSALILNLFSPELAPLLHQPIR